MANADSTALTSASNIRQYISLENYDIASVKAQQLDALIAAITGEGFASFMCMNDDLKHWYLMAISEQAIKNGENHAK